MNRCEWACTLLLMRYFGKRVARVVKCEARRSYDVNGESDTSRPHKLIFLQITKATKILINVRNCSQDCLSLIFSLAPSLCATWLKCIKEFPSGLKGRLLLQRFAVTKQPEVICFPKEWVIFRDVNDSDRWTVEQSWEKLSFMQMSSDAVRQSCFKRLVTLFRPNLKIDLLLSFAEKAMP